MSSKKEKILFAAFKLIAKHGYDKTTINMICEEVGIKKPSLYYFFESKEAVFLEVVDYYFDVHVYEYELFEDKTGSPNYDLNKFGEKLFEYYNDNEEMLRVGLEFYIQASRITSFDKKLSELTDKTLELLKEYFIEVNAEEKLKNTKDIDIVIELLTAILFNAELSFVMKQELDYLKLWKFTVDTYFEK